MNGELEEFQVPPELIAAQVRHAQKAQEKKLLQAHEQWFLRGPVPMDWLARAQRCGGAALAVGLELWHLRGLRPRRPGVYLNLRETRMRIPRRSAQRGLRRLAADGLVSVAFENGRKSVVRILDGDDSPDQEVVGQG